MAATAILLWPEGKMLLWTCEVVDLVVICEVGVEHVRYLHCCIRRIC